jgi:hypothetical protein
VRPPDDLRDLLCGWAAGDLGGAVIGPHLVGDPDDRALNAGQMLRAGQDHIQELAVAGYAEVRGQLVTAPLRPQTSHSPGCVVLPAGQGDPLCVEIPLLRHLGRLPTMASIAYQAVTAANTNRLTPAAPGSHSGP